MAREKEVLAVMAKLVIASVKEIALVMAALGFWAAGVSAINNSSKSLKNLGSQLEALGKGVYRWPGCRSEWGTHAQKLSQELARILAKYPQSQVRREISLPISRRADALVLIRDQERAACLWLETVVSETEGSIADKRREAYAWPEALKFMSQQFGVEVPSFTFVTSNEINTILEG